MKRDVQMSNTMDQKLLFLTVALSKVILQENTLLLTALGWEGGLGTKN